MEKWGVRPDQIKLVEYNLLSDQGSEFFVTEGEIADTRSYIRGGIADMESLLIDVETNTPKEKIYFRKTEVDRTRDRCNFRKVCESRSSE